jgi:ankyrin repeat protein|tara:strand:- start:13 stop:561 length:549 start_codon:yes stop_codon:yes gene_type:complete
MENIFKDWLVSFKKDVLKDLIIEFSHEIKPGYKHAIKLTNKEQNHKTWISSTDKPDEREKALKGYLKNKKNWYNPWLDNFGDLDQNTILEKIKFEHFDISSLSYEDLVNNSFDKKLISENFKKEFKNLLREFTTENNISNRLTLELAKDVENLMNQYEKNNAVIVKDLIEKIDEIILKYVNK